MRKLLIILLFGTYLLGCEEQTDWQSNGSSETMLVVEGIVTNELKPHVIQLSTTYKMLDGASPMVTDALVFLNDGDSTYTLSQTAPGMYETPPFRAVINRNYILGIFWKGQEFYAIANAAFGSPLEQLILDTLSNEQYEFVYPESDQPSMTEVHIHWPSDSIKAYYYTLDVIDINRIFAPEKERLIFPAGATVIRKKYSLSPGHQVFLRSLLSEIDWRGGIFDVAQGNVISNLSDGAVGFFGVSMVDVDTTIVF